MVLIISMASISMAQLKIHAQVLLSPTGGPIVLMLSPAGAVENVLSSHSASSQVVLCHLLSSVVLIVIILTIIIRGFINSTSIPTSIIIFISNIIIAIIASQTNSCFQTFPKEGASPPHSTIASMALMYQVKFDILSKILFCFV